MRVDPEGGRIYNVLVRVWVDMEVQVQAKKNGDARIELDQDNLNARVVNELDNAVGPMVPVGNKVLRQRWVGAREEKEIRALGYIDDGVD